MKVSLLSDSSTAPYGEKMQNPKLRYFKPLELDHTGFGLPESVVAPNAPGNVEESLIENAA